MPKKQKNDKLRKKKQPQSHPQKKPTKHQDPFELLSSPEKEVNESSVSPPKSTVVQPQQQVKRTKVNGVPLPAGMTKKQFREMQDKLLQDQLEESRRRDLLCQLEMEEDGSIEEGSADSVSEDYSDTANERKKEYKKGGYHPVFVGETYNNRYRVIQKLGWGYFSTVWLVWDYDANQYFAMKVQKSAQHYRDAAFDEIRLLSEIMAADETGTVCCARMTDHFEHVGPHGTHVVMVFEVLGENLLSLMERYNYKGIPIPIVKSMAKNMLIGLRHIHSIDILHTDIKPENVLLQQPKHKFQSIMKHYVPPPRHENLSLLKRDASMLTKSQKRRLAKKLRDLKKKGLDPEELRAAEAEATKQAKEERDADAEDSQTDPEWEVERFHHVTLADFGNSCWTYKQFTDEVQTRQYRSPEVITGDPYGTAIDIWSCACTVFELITGEFLFDPKETDGVSRDEDHLALMMELLGPLPEHMSMGNGKFRHKFFNSQGELRHVHEFKYWSLRDVLHQKYRFTLKKANEIAEFLLPMLAHDPEERATADEMLSGFQDFFEVQEDDYEPLCRTVFREDGAEDEESGYEDEDEDEGDQRPADEEQQLVEWMAGHPLLNPAALEKAGLSIIDVYGALRGQKIEDEEKSTKVLDLLAELEVHEAQQRATKQHGRRENDPEEEDEEEDVEEEFEDEES